MITDPQQITPELAQAVLALPVRRWGDGYRAPLRGFGSRFR